MLWDKTFDELGVYLGKPQVTRAENGDWVLMVGYGYNNSTNKSGLLVIKLSDGSILKKIETTAGSSGLAAGQNVAGLLMNIALMLYLAFFLLRDGHQLVELLIRALPLGDERERMLFAKFAEVTRATVKGNLVVAVVQGTLGGMIFWFLDLPAPVLWGVVMTFLSLLPAIGAALVWFPVALYLYATGQWWPATILIAYGARLS